LELPRNGFTPVRRQGAIATSLTKPGRLPITGAYQIKLPKDLVRKKKSAGIPVARQSRHVMRFSYILLLFFNFSWLCFCDAPNAVAVTSNKEPHTIAILQTNLGDIYFVEHKDMLAALYLRAGRFAEAESRFQRA
jgi:hypothetical protein